ncbi:hypothetical protein DFQ27_001793 [Actinomortierella ambigua]|uniref:F-box domain-containing protein n=1 Tax=Actinomortierella ambigua TaxID=1343610 RepID=A0A9P6QDA5_9FUNG|nr:hypothetical protein DFQ27_001793 [Actinomortierella ambigua]
MNNIQPMDLPELRMMVARHLSSRSLKACTRVCKAWHTSFQPVVWSRFSIHEKYLMEFCQRDKVTRCVDSNWGRSFACNGHYIRNLALVTILGGELFQECLRLIADRCTSLTTLSFESGIRLGIERPESILNLIQAVIEQNPGIQKLSTSRVYCLSLDIYEGLSTQDIVCLLATFPLLEELSVKVSTPSKLEDNEQQPTTDHSTVKQRPSAVKRLTMYGMNSPTGLTTVLERCPKLESMQFQFIEDVHGEATNILPPEFLSDATLTFTHSSTGAIRQILRILAYQQILTFTLDNTSADAFQAIAESHSHRFKHIVISYRAAVPGSLLTILAECVSLKTLRVVEDRAEPSSRIPLPLDLRALIARPWGCVDLEELEMPLALERHRANITSDQVMAATTTSTTTTTTTTAMDDGNEAGSWTELGLSEWQRAELLFMKRLAALTHLRRLTLTGGVSIGLKAVADMAWRLPTGLEHLKDLKCLELLDLSGRKRFQSIDDQYLEQLTLVDFNCVAVSPMTVLATSTALKTLVVTSMHSMSLDVRKVVT